MFNSNLSKEDKDFIIKMSAIALISSLGNELIKFGMHELRNLFKKKEAPIPAATETDPASKTVSSEKKGEVK